MIGTVIIPDSKISGKTSKISECLHSAGSNKALKKFDAGLHLKTSGTTWLEEFISLAMAGGDGLKIAQKIYEEAMRKYDELCTP